MADFWPLQVCGDLGVGEVTVGHVDERVPEGGFALVRKSVRHRFWNPSDVNARMLVVGHPQIQLLVEEIAPLVRRGDFDAVPA